jgi:hypothetical protein
MNLPPSFSRAHSKKGYNRLEAKCLCLLLLTSALFPESLHYYNKKHRLPRAITERQPFLRCKRRQGANGE